MATCFWGLVCGFVFISLPPSKCPSRCLVLCFLVSLLEGKQYKNLSFSMLINLKREESFHFVEVNKVTELSLEQSGCLKQDDQV